MELWVRSQDKEILVKVNNLSLALNKDETCEIINSFEDHQCWELGTYTTKKRALEILDEIQSLLKPKYMAKEINTPITNRKIDIEVFPYGTIVYEIPEE